MLKRETDSEDRDNVVEFPGDLDPAQFRISGTDSKGHTSRVWASMQPMHVQTIDILCQSGKFPYRTRGDFIRHAIVRHIHWLEKIFRPVNSITGALDAMNALLRDSEFRMEFTEYIGRLTNQIDMLVEEGDLPAARKLLLETLRHVENMPDGYWKEKYLLTIRDRNKKLLDDMPRADLFNFEDHEGEENAGTAS